MLILSAPIQGYTDYVWRRSHATVFGGINRYYSPFLRIERGEMRKRDLADVAPTNNEGYEMIPQILACPPDHALRMATTLSDMGYHEIDINMGCPYPPLAQHHKGSGIIPFPDEVEQLFSTLATITGVRFSVKMRLGLDEPSQWRRIVPLFDIINPTQVTLHPRYGRQQYRGELNLDEFADACALIKYPLIYNGDVKSREDILKYKNMFPSISGIMIGRGLIENPAMLIPEKANSVNYKQLHDTIFNDYSTRMNGGDKQLLIKMKAFWEMYLPFAPHRYLKAIKKANSIDRYNAAVSELFATMND